MRYRPQIKSRSILMSLSMPRCDFYSYNHFTSVGLSARSPIYAIKCQECKIYDEIPISNVSAFLNAPIKYFSRVASHNWQVTTNMPAGSTGNPTWQVNVDIRVSSRVNVSSSTINFEYNIMLGFSRSFSCTDSIQLFYDVEQITIGLIFFYELIKLMQIFGI